MTRRDDWRELLRAVCSAEERALLFAQLQHSLIVDGLLERALTHLADARKLVTQAQYEECPRRTEQCSENEPFPMDDE